MYTPNQQPQQKPPQMLGDLQNNFTYRLSNFIGNDQITIVEDLPRNRPVREATKMSVKGKPYNVYLIRINANGFEADLELFSYELNQIAIACPKGTENFKGVTLVHNGRTFVYLSTSHPLDTNVPQRTDPRQPDLYPAAAQPTAQVDVVFTKIVNSIATLDALGNKVDIAVLMKICEAIQPGKALDLIAAAKAQGYIYENDGVYKVA